MPFNVRITWMWLWPLREKEKGGAAFESSEERTPGWCCWVGAWCSHSSTLFSRLIDCVNSTERRETGEKRMKGRQRDDGDVQGGWRRDREGNQSTKSSPTILSLLLTPSGLLGRNFGLLLFACLSLPHSLIFALFHLFVSPLIPSFWMRK